MIEITENNAAIIFLMADALRKSLKETIVVNDNLEISKYIADILPNNLRINGTFYILENIKKFPTKLKINGSIMMHHAGCIKIS